MRLLIRASLHKDPLRVPADVAGSHPLCIHCKHYLPPTHYGINIQDKKKGFCEKSGMMHVVDGSIEYERVEHYRQFTCKGMFYETEEIPSMDVIDVFTSSISEEYEKDPSRMT